MFAWRSNVTGLYSMSHKGKQLYCYTVHVIHCTNKPNTRTLAHKHLTCLTALFSRVRFHKKLGTTGPLNKRKFANGSSKKLRHLVAIRSKLSQ